MAKDIIVENAHSPKWVNQDQTAVDLMVKFAHLPNDVPFTASLNDSEIHGIELFVRAANKEFGEPLPYEAPPIIPESEESKDSKRLSKVIKYLATMQGKTPAQIRAEIDAL